MNSGTGPSNGLRKIRNNVQKEDQQGKYNRV